MPTEYSARSQCVGKRRYDTKAEAKKFAARAERSIGRCIAYRCPHCGWFHVGHKPKTPKAA